MESWVGDCKIPTIFLINAPQKPNIPVPFLALEDNKPKGASLSPPKLT